MSEDTATDSGTTLLREMARSAQRQLDEWAGPHPDYVGVELPLSVGALRLLTRLPALIAQARADGAAEERERIKAVRVLHPSTPLTDGTLVCATCRDDEPWPCPTRLALDAEVLP